MRNLLPVLSLCVGLIIGGTHAAAAEPLPALGVQPQITVSGLSSGAFMAHQLHVVFPDRIKGAAIIAGGPYGCAKGQLVSALTDCMHYPPLSFTGPPGSDRTVAKVLENADLGRIGLPEHLADSKVMLVSGTADALVPASVLEAVAEVYRPFIAADRLKRITDIPSGHGWPTPETGVDCGETEPPFLNACGRDLAGEILSWLIGDLFPRGTSVAEHLIRFDQTPYFPGEAEASLSPRGFVYVPASCRSGGCRLHIALHGCKQGGSSVGETFVRGTGLNDWAESNQIVILYPQAEASYLRYQNPNGCWDWWGFTGEDYLTRDALQMRAILAMVYRLSVEP